MTYSKALRLLLARSGMSQADLARATGMSTAYISQLCKGSTKEPTLSKAFAIADALGVKLQDFVDLMETDE